MAADGIGDAVGDEAHIVNDGFHFYIDEVSGGQEFKDFVQGRGFFAAELGGEPRAGVQFADFGKGGVAYQPAPSGDAAEGAVVKDHQLPVLSDADVQFDAVGAAAIGGGESREGVFGGAGYIAAVGDNQGKGAGAGREAPGWGQGRGVG